MHNWELLTFEQVLLDLGSYKDVTSGVFMMAIYKTSDYTVHFFESGSLIGYMHNSATAIMTSQMGITTPNL